MSFFKRLSQKIRGRGADPRFATSSPDLSSALDPDIPINAKSELSHQSMIGGRFEVVDEFVGGMGVVYVCLDHQKDLPVALKTFKPEYLPDRVARDRFLREGTIWVDLGRHPHIVRCSEVFAPGIEPEAYLVLDLIAPAPGKTEASLRAWLVPEQSLSNRQSLLFTLQIVRGMQHATARRPGLVHRDLKPENVLVGPDGIARITDFGLASVLSQLDTQTPKSVEDEELLHRTHLTRDFVGTPLYMAPEQWIPGETLDARVDIYAVGCILYEMLTGKTVVSGRNLAELEDAHRLGRIREIPPGLPREVADLVHGCIATDREKRYQTWQELESVLVEAYRVVAGEDAPAAPCVGPETREERVAVAWSYQVIGDSYRKIGKYDVAQRYFQRGVETGKKEKERWLEAAGLHNLGITHLGKGDAMIAIERLEDALSIAREIGWAEEGAVLAGIGNAHRDLGDMQRATEYYEQALAYSRAKGDLMNVGATLNSMGNLHRRSGRLAEAINLYEQALPIMEKLGDRAGAAMILDHLGICYRKQQEIPRAINLFEQALGISREVGDWEGAGRALGNLANAYGDLGDVQRSIELSRQALAIAQETGNKRAEGIAMGNLGRNYQNLGESREAIRYYEQSLVIAHKIGDMEGLARTSFNLAVVLGELNKPTEAIPHAQVSLQAYRQLGHEQFAMGAQELIARLQNLSKRKEHWDRGVAYANQNLWDEAIREYQAALHLDPENAAVQYNLGVVYWKSGRIREAIPRFETAIRLAPNFDEARRELGSVHCDLGLIYGHQGQLEEAIGEFQTALHVNPDCAEAHNYLGLTYGQKERPEEAISEFQAALRVNPVYTEARYNLGLAYQIRGQQSDAIQQFKALLQTDPNHSDARLHLAGYHMQQGHLNEAIREYQAVLRVNPNFVEVHYNLGLAYYNQGRVTQAVSEFRLAARAGFEPAQRALAQLERR